MVMGGGRDVRPSLSNFFDSLLGALLCLCNAGSAIVYAVPFILHSRNKPKTVADPVFSPGGGAKFLKPIVFQCFAENCMKMKEFGPREL